MAKKILLVDDEPLILTVVTSRLKSAGYDVVTAADGEQALAKVSSEKPDLIILDVMMPKLDGFQTCAVLKQDQRFQKIPIIVFTAKAGEEAQDIGINDCGADAYLTKPFEPEKLFEKIKELISP